MRGISFSASGPETSAIATGLLPNQRPSGGQPLVRTGLPQPTTSKRVHSRALAGLSTIQLWTEKMPFQAPVVAVNTMTRAGLSSAAFGSMPVLDQLASRHERGPSLAA